MINTQVILLTWLTKIFSKLQNRVKQHVHPHSVQIPIQHISALNIHHQLLRRGHCFWSVEWLAWVNCLTVTTGRKSPELLIKAATSETVNRLGADRQDKWCGSRCSSFSFPLSLYSPDGPERNRTPVIESITVDINREKPWFLRGLLDCCLLNGWCSHQAEIRLVCFSLPNFRLWKRQPSLYNYYFYFFNAVTSNALQIWKKISPDKQSPSLSLCPAASFFLICVIALMVDHRKKNLLLPEEPPSPVPKQLQAWLFLHLS